MPSRSLSRKTSTELGDAARLTGIGVSEGVTVGPVFAHAGAEFEPGRKNILEEAVEEELARFHRAIESVGRRLSERAHELRESGREEEAGIFEFHAEMADDPELASAVEEHVRNLESPEAAVLAVGEQHAGDLASMEHEYLGARADDVRDVTRQIAAELMGRNGEGLEAIEEPSVIVARSLAPSDTAGVPKEMVLGFVTAEGSVTSHVSIMARSMSIPAVVGVGPAALESALEAATIAVDGGEGVAIVDPDPETVTEFEAKQRAVAREHAVLEEYRYVESRTQDGRRIEVSANLGSASEVQDALSWGAEGVGLFRTEFLFMERAQLPSEDEQYESYGAVARVFGDKPVIVRTLDVGGDKNLPVVNQPEEQNPFLGWRGIRMSLDAPELFKPQLRAILRAGALGNLKIMFPMISDVEELRSAKQVFVECREELEGEGQEIGRVEVGIMVETPAAAILARELAPEVSFFSIGTNDLVQYTLAADRGNERLRRLQSADHPAVLELIRMTCEAAREHGIWVGVCGEAAADTAMIPKLVELGVTELSMSAPSIPRAKKAIAEL
jgi:phosphoenolpyruvate-protein phosphotransferase (PTS system enzyme I)